MISRKIFKMAKLFTRFIDLLLITNLEITGKEDYIIVIELLLSTKDFQCLIRHNMREESYVEP